MLKLLPLLASFLVKAAAGINYQKPFSYFPKPSNCEASYKCSDWIPYHYECPAGLHVNLATTRCDYLANIGCDPNTPAPSEPTTVGPSITTCTPRDGANSEIDLENPKIIIEPRKEGECSNPPIRIPIFPGQKKNITLTYRLKFHPMDVYYIMDLSKSMGDEKANLVKLGSDLVAALKNMTKDFKVGFGVLVDKPTRMLGGTKGGYSVKNVMPLTSAIDDFAERVGSTITKGYDAPESAGDALAQVAPGENGIGWRSHTRRMVVLASAAPFRLIGNGKAQDIPSSFDGNCHLDAAGKYHDELLYDYPSIDQLSHILNVEGVTTILTVTSQTSSFSKSVENKIESGSVGTLSSDSSNIIQLFQDVYHEIESRVELKEVETTRDSTIKYFSSCGSFSTPKETQKCQGVCYQGELVCILQIEPNYDDYCSNYEPPTPYPYPVGLPTFIDVTIELICEDRRPSSTLKYWKSPK